MNTVIDTFDFGQLQESDYNNPAGSSNIFSLRPYSQFTSLACQKSRTNQPEPTPSDQKSGSDCQKSRSNRQIPGLSHQNSESSSATPAVDSTESRIGHVFQTRGLKCCELSYRFILVKAGWDITKKTLFVNPLTSVIEMPLMIWKAWVLRQRIILPSMVRFHMMEKAKSFIISLYVFLGLSPERLKDRVDYPLRNDRLNCYPEHYEHFSAPQIPRVILYCYYKMNQGIGVNHREFESCINQTFIYLVSTVLYHALRVHVIGGSSWKSGVFNKNYCGSEFLLLRHPVTFPHYPSFSQSMITSPILLAYSHAVLAYSQYTIISTAVLSNSNAVLAYSHASLSFSQSIRHFPGLCILFPTFVAFPSFSPESFHSLSLSVILCPLHHLPGTSIIFQVFLSFSRPSSHPPGVSVIFQASIRGKITKCVKLTNCCKLPSMESREALVDPGVGNFLVGLSAKLNDGNNETGIYPDDLESSFVNDDNMNSCSAYEDIGGKEIDGAEHSNGAEHSDGAERSAGNSSSRQLVLEDDEPVNTVVESEDSQDNIPVRRRGSRRRGWGQRVR
ncbi:hypothetical protein DFP73DRAFT_523925 [Morchella snyderi]|nr:hypothetical protein DFP73DRAFT_523925 [Morchella snyderi]